MCLLIVRVQRSSPRQHASIHPGLMSLLFIPSLLSRNTYVHAKCHSRGRPSRKCSQWPCPLPHTSHGRYRTESSSTQTSEGSQCPRQTWEQVTLPSTCTYWMSRCWYCANLRNPKRRRETVWYCSDCRLHLCHTGDSDDCFMLYHKRHVDM